MADDTADAPNRATVAQALAEIRGLRDFVDARFTDTQRQLTSVTGLPEAVSALQERVAALDKREKDSDADMDRRVSALEGASSGDRNFRRGSLPIILATIGLLLVGIAQVIASLTIHP